MEQSKKTFKMKKIGEINNYVFISSETDVGLIFNLIPIDEYKENVEYGGYFDLEYISNIKNVNLSELRNFIKKDFNNKDLQEPKRPKRMSGEFAESFFDYLENVSEDSYIMCKYIKDLEEYILQLKKNGVIK